MIELRALGCLNAQRQKDAKVLFKGNRYAAAVYLMGYALEYALKRRICECLKFDRGFPEWNEEFKNYKPQVDNYNLDNPEGQLNHLWQIKNHRLDDLLFFSGIRKEIHSRYYSDWLTVRDWNPEDRYKLRRYGSLKCRKFIRSARIILKQIRKFHTYE